MKYPTVILYQDTSFRNTIISSIINSNSFPEVYRYTDLPETSFLSEYPIITPENLRESQNNKIINGERTNVLYVVEVFKKETAKSLEKLVFVARSYYVSIVICIQRVQDVPPATRKYVKNVYTMTDISDIEKRWLPKLYTEATIVWYH